MTVIFWKEFTGFLNSLMAYLVMAVFLISLGLIMWVFPDTSVLEYGYADMDNLFSLGPFVMIFLAPAIAMRSFAEEQKMGTLELLLTKPVSEWSVVLGKFFACWLLAVVTLLPTIVYFVSIWKLGNPPGNIDAAGVAGSYAGFFLLGGVFCAVGLLCSALTHNQIIAFLLGAFACYVWYAGLDAISGISSTGAMELYIKQAGLLFHYEAMGKGLIDSRNVVFMLSAMAAVLVATKTFISSRSW